MLKFLQIRYIFSFIWKFIFTTCYKVTFKNFWVSYILYFILLYGLIWGFSFYCIYFLYTNFTNIFVANNYNFSLNSTNYIYSNFQDNLAPNLLNTTKIYNNNWPAFCAVLFNVFTKAVLAEDNTISMQKVSDLWRFWHKNNNTIFANQSLLFHQKYECWRGLEPRSDITLNRDWELDFILSPLAVKRWIVGILYSRYLNPNYFPALYEARIAHNFVHLQYAPEFHVANLSRNIMPYTAEFLWWKTQDTDLFKYNVNYSAITSNIFDEYNIRQMLYYQFAVRAYALPIYLSNKSEFFKKTYLSLMFTQAINHDHFFNIGTFKKLNVNDAHTVNSFYYSSRELDPILKVIPHFSYKSGLLLDETLIRRSIPELSKSEPYLKIGTQFFTKNLINFFPRSIFGVKLHNDTTDLINYFNLSTIDGISNSLRSVLNFKNLVFLKPQPLLNSFPYVFYNGFVNHDYKNITYMATNNPESHSKELYTCFDYDGFVKKDIFIYHDTFLNTNRITYSDLYKRFQFWDKQSYNDIAQLFIYQCNFILMSFWNLYFKLLLEFNVIFFNIFLYSFVSLIFLHCFFSLNHVFKDYIRNINNSLYIFYFYLFIYLIFRLCLFVTSLYNLWFWDFNSLIIGSFIFLLLFSIFHYNKIILLNFFNYWIISLLVVVLIIGGQFINNFFSKLFIWGFFSNIEYNIRFSLKPISIISDMLTSLNMLIETSYMIILLEIKLLFFDLLINLFNILYLY